MSPLNTGHILINAFYSVNTISDYRFILQWADFCNSYLKEACLLYATNIIHLI